MTTNPAQVNYPQIPGTSAELQRELTNLRRMIYQQQNVAPTAPAPATNTTVNAPVTAQVSTSSTSGPVTPTSPSAYANIPVVTFLPSTNPVAGAPYAVDGTVISYNNVLYRYDATALTWVHAEDAVTMTGLRADRPAETGYPAGTFYFATDTELLYIIESIGGVLTWENINGPFLLNGTHANRLASTPSVEYALYTQYYETDRTMSYWAQNATGTVNTAGTAVTWVSGNKFINTGSGFNAAQWPAGTSITINAVVYHVASVTNSGALTLTTSAGVQAGVSYSVASGRWVYLSGEYKSVLASLPTDLGENDANALWFENAVYNHQLLWSGTAWQRGPHDLEHSDTFHEFGAVPTDIGWAACDGANATYLKYDGTTASRATPNLNGTAAYAKGGGSYSATLTAPTLPTVTTTVPAATAAAAATAGTGTAETAVITPTPVLIPPFTGGGGGGGGGGTNIAGTVTLPGDPIENFSVIKMYRR